MAERKSAQGGKLFAMGFGLIGVVFGGLMAWAVLAPFEGAVIAPGSIVVESHHQAIQHLEGGIVAEIMVHDGDRVEEGDLLLRLDGTTINASMASLEARLSDLAAREARLSAERDEASTDLSIRDSLQDLSGTPQLEAALASQAALMAARRQSRETQISILQQRIQQLGQKINGLRAEVNSKTDQAGMIDEEVEGLQTLFDKGLAPKGRLLALQREGSQLIGAKDALVSEIAATEVAIGEAKLEILNLTDGFREKVLDELSMVQTEINELSEERAALRDKKRRLEIRAPRDGRTLGMTAHTIGGVIAPGEPILHIVPAEDSLVAMVRISPNDIDKVQSGQQAMLRFSAFSHHETPEVDATVVDVSADAVQDEQSGMMYYEGTVEIPEDLTLPPGFQLLPGMPVEAMLRTESRNVLSYLTKPARDAMSRTFRE